MAGGAPLDQSQAARGTAAAGGGGGLTAVTGFKIKLVLLLVEAFILWLYDTGRVEMIVILGLSALLLALAHPWKMKGGRALHPEIVACMIGVTTVITFLLTFAMLVGVPGLATWVDESGRQLVHLPTPKREIPQPWAQNPAATPTTALPQPGQ